MRNSATTAPRICPRSPTSRMQVGILVLAAVVFPIACGQKARAQDDWDVPKKPVDQPDQNGRFGVPDFDQWVLGGKTRDQTERMLKSLLTLKIQSANRDSALSAAQLEKLQLAGEGELKRIYRRIEQAQEKYRAVGQDQKKIQEFYRQVSSLRTELEGDVFGASSLYQKVLPQTLDKDQSARHEQQERERRSRTEERIEGA